MKLTFKITCGLLLAFLILCASGVAPSILPTGGSQTAYLQIEPNTGNASTYRWNKIPSVAASDYAWNQSPGGSLAMGSNSVTLTPCPLGVAGANASYDVYISGGSGTPESVAVTGGTCSSGASSGTITFNTTSSHSGAWTIGSATAGLAEAYFAGNTSATVTGAVNVYGPATFTTTFGVACQQGGTITVNQTNGTVFTFNGSSGSYAFNGCTLRIAGGTTANVTALNVVADQEFWSGNNVLAGFHLFYYLSGTAGINRITGNSISNSYTGGAGIYIAGPSGNTVVDGNVFGSPLNVMLACADIASGTVGGFWFLNNDCFQAQYGLLIQGSAGQVFSTNNAYFGEGTYGIWLAPSSGNFLRTFISTADDIESAGTFGINVSGSGKIDALNFSNCKVNYSGNQGISLSAGANTTISNCTVAANSASSSGSFPGLYIDTSNVSVRGGVYAPADGQTTGSDPNTQNYGIQIASGTLDYVSIIGAFTQGNLTGGISNAATGTHNLIKDNPGYNPVGSTAVTPGSSPYTYTAGPSPTQLYMTGGTVSSVTVGGRTACSVSPCAIMLYPNESAVVTYSAAPTITADVQ